MLQDKVIAIYCLVDDLLKEMNHSEHNNRKFTDGQIITTALVSALHFRGNQTMSLDYMDSHIFDHVLKKSGFTKRLHKLKEILMFILLRIGRIFKYMCCEMEYIIDSFPREGLPQYSDRPLQTLQGGKVQGLQRLQTGTFLRRQDTVGDHRRRHPRGDVPCPRCRARLADPQKDVPRPAARKLLVRGQRVHQL